MSMFVTTLASRYPHASTRRARAKASVAIMLATAGVIGLTAPALSGNSELAKDAKPGPMVRGPIGGIAVLPAPQRASYRVALNSFRITDTRSVHNDTDMVAFSVAVGRNAPITVTKSMG